MAKAASPWLAAGKPRRQEMTRLAVGQSADLRRVRDLPRRRPVDLRGQEGAELARTVTGLCQLPSPRCRCASVGHPCIEAFNSVQGFALSEMARVGGLLAPIGVGHGKTVLDVLAACVVERCRLAVLLVPPHLVDQLHREYQVLAGHFRVPSLILPDGGGGIVPGAPAVHVVPYSRLCRPEATRLLEELAPDLVVADECHRLRHPDTATTARVLRYFENHPETRFCGWSGTLTKGSLKDYAHLAALALGHGSPCPLDPRVVDEWAEALDPSDWPAPGGALAVALGAADRTQPALHSAFRARLVETAGVVATEDAAVEASLYVAERTPPKVPAEVAGYLKELRERWVRPDGEELVDRLAMARSASELACGFYYKWVFPRGESEALKKEWLAARKEWHQELRRKLAGRREHLDSPLLCQNAAVRAWAGYEGDLPTWKAVTWPRWRDVRDRVKPETEPVWISDWLAKDAVEWARGEPGIVWYEHAAFGDRVARLGGLVRFGAGPAAAAAIAEWSGKASCVCSAPAHGTGRDGLQYHYRRMLLTSPPSSGAAFEQILGRLHRAGQSADEVEVWVYRHTQELRDAFDSAVRGAEYIQGTLGGRQKLLLASVAW